MVVLLPLEANGYTCGGTINSPHRSTGLLEQLFKWFVLTKSHTVIPLVRLMLSCSTKVDVVIASLGVWLLWPMKLISIRDEGPVCLQKVWMRRDVDEDAVWKRAEESSVVRETSLFPPALSSNTAGQVTSFHGNKI